MNNTYTSLVNQTFHFPQEGFELNDNGYLQFNDLDLKKIIEKHGTPLKLTYLPKIGMQINKAKDMFKAAFKKHKYEGEYFYCYCTKSSHFSFVVEEALKHNIHLETSYAYDIEIINRLYQRRKINKETYIICNGYKQKSYTSRITKLINSGFKNVIPILDNKEELMAYKRGAKQPFRVGIRVAAEEEPNFPFYTSTHIYSVLAEKNQNDRECWYMIDSSFITTLPDTWGIGEKFLMLPVNKWDNEYHRVVLGGITCDSHDYYDSEEHINEVFLPKLKTLDPKDQESNKEPLYVGFFHTGAYQDQISGYGGIKHCLIPSPKHVIVERDRNGKLIEWVYAKEQTAQSMLKILGYLR